MSVEKQLSLCSCEGSTFDWCGKAHVGSRLFAEQASLCSAGENKSDFCVQAVKVIKSMLKGG